LSGTENKKYKGLLMAAQINKKSASQAKSSKRSASSKKAEALDARRRLEACLEEKRLSRELSEFDFDY
jgi:hypothetical protein